MQEAFMAFVQQFGYVAVGALIFLENVFPPIPSELILPLAGFLSRDGSLRLPLTIAAAAVGSLTGAYVLYAAGTVLNRERLAKLLTTKPMRLLGFEEGDVQSAFGWFDHKGRTTVLFCRCIPVVRSLISVPAGMARMPLTQFTVYTVLGSTVWNTLLCSLGWWAGSAWQNVSTGAAHVIDYVTYAIVFAALAVAALWVVKRVVPRFKDDNRAAA